MQCNGFLCERKYLAAFCVLYNFFKTVKYLSYFKTLKLGSYQFFVMFVMFYDIYKAVLSPKEVIHKTTFRWSETKRRREKPLTHSRPIIYYKNTTATRRNILFRGIEISPNPRKNNPLKHCRQFWYHLRQLRKSHTFQC